MTGSFKFIILRLSMHFEHFFLVFRCEALVVQPVRFANHAFIFNLIKVIDYYFCLWFQCGGTGLLETLPEAESEEEECESISPSREKSEEQLYRMTRSPLVSSASPSSSSSSSASNSNDSSPQSEFPPEFTSLLESSFGGGKLQVAKSLEDFAVLQQCEAENKKINVLQSIIQQLRDELKECKDQNELLEFRLLEMQELSTSPVRQHQVC